MWLRRWLLTLLIRDSSFVIPMPPVILSIAGSDCSSGAGAQADLKTITALGGYGLTALTSVVSETPAKVSRVQLLEAELVEDQIRVLDGAFPIAAVKTGMLGGEAQVEAVVRAWTSLHARGVPLVIDPVMVATSGGRLLDEGATGALVGRLFPLARVITPNMDEAAVLAGSAIGTRDEMVAAARGLGERFQCAVLLKGGHLKGGEAADVLVDGSEVQWFENRRIPGVHTHGTGCTMSAAIATGLAHGLKLCESVRKAKDFVTRAIEQHYRWGTVDALNHQAPPVCLESPANASKSVRNP
jgi:hydroxymethylpyrimidine/phosphomethylpyrimidine kinase